MGCKCNKNSTPTSLTRKFTLFPSPTSFCSNKIKTTKYNIFTFLPLSILFQFTNYSNIYFLIVAIIFSIKTISPQNTTVALIPFICVILLGVLVELFEEIKKWRNDSHLNNSKAIKVDTTTNKETEVKWSELLVGDIIKVNKNEMVPADILLLSTSTNNYFCYMQSTNLDGENALKPREVLLAFQQCFPFNEQTTSSSTLNTFTSTLNGVVVEIDSPNNDIHKCNGTIEFPISSSNKHCIQIDNTLLRGTILKNTDYVYGLILYTGLDTKIMRNIQQSKVKSSSIENIINSIIIGIVISVFVLCIVCTIGGYFNMKQYIPNYNDNDIKYEYIYYYEQGDTFNYTLEFFRLFAAYFVLLNNIIPISMTIAFTIAKVVQLLMIEFDWELMGDKDDKVRVFSTRLQEDLGKVRYIFTDKTGTLTKNEMVFKGCSIYGVMYYKNNETREDTTMIKVEDTVKDAFTTNPPLQVVNDTSCLNNTSDAIYQFGLNIALNHTVLSEYNEETNTKTYQGPNPDEVALVTAVKYIGIEFIQRVGNVITINTTHCDNDSNEITFQVLQTFNYNSSRKRSGIIVKNISSNEIVLYIKGADEKIFASLNEHSMNNLLEQTKEHLDIFAKDGLRTLCYAFKRISESCFNEWNERYERTKAEAMLDKKKEMEVEMLIEEIEKEMTLLGVSGLEDKLQDEVKEDVCKFIEAGIQMWMITGDQMKTAESIGYASGFFENDTEIYRIKANDSLNDIERLLKIIKHNVDIALNEDINILQLTDSDNNNDNDGDMSMIQFLLNQKMIPEYTRTLIANTLNESNINTNNNNCNNNNNTFITYINNPSTNNTLQNIYTSYLNELNTILHTKHLSSIITKFTSLDLPKPTTIPSNIELTNYSLIIEGIALHNILTSSSTELHSLFLSVLSHSRSIICSRCTPIQKSSIVSFIKSHTNNKYDLCLAIGDGGNDVNMIKTANIGIGIYGKEGHQAAHNSDYAISQFKYLKRLLFYHGRSILMRNSYFIYFFFYKGLLLCIPTVWYAFYSCFSGANLFDAVRYLLYTGPVSTITPVIIMVFEEDFDADFDDITNTHLKHKMKTLLPDVYKEYRDSNPFNVGRFFIIFFLAIAHSSLFFFWSIYAYNEHVVNAVSDGKDFSLWDISMVNMVTLFFVQYLTVFLDTNKVYPLVIAAHAVQIIINIIIGLVRAFSKSDELGAYNWDVCSSWILYLMLGCVIYMCMIPVYVSKYANYLFSDSVINNIRYGRECKEFKRRMLVKKINQIRKCKKCLDKFKCYLNDNTNNNGIEGCDEDNYCNKKLKEVVEVYKEMKRNENVNVNERVSGESQMKLINAYTS